MIWMMLHPNDAIFPLCKLMSPGKQQTLDLQNLLLPLNLYYTSKLPNNTGRLFWETVLSVLITNKNIIEVDMFLSVHT